MLGKASFFLAVDEGPSDIIEVEKSELLLEKLEPHPNLQHLTVEHFKDFTSLPLFPSLHQELRLEHAKARLLRETMATSSSSLILAPLSKLKHLYLEAIPDLESLPQLQNLTSLQKLEILSCPKLASMSQDMGRLKCLQHLKIVDCDELISDDSDAMEWGDLGSLQSLNIRGLPKLTSPPKGLQFVTNRQELTSIIVLV
ncbi:hypothetical protein GH714_034508 [Hevea brasiliensis]|uniref:NB-ARC domain-containing protein n=1 Tax=Hevea brasiliensis TaxID=3981 RepID=A0A6A6N8H8_HEVBR|nr:hypothetical protein GH714_034508 [Hevea brasiliensis]